MRTVVHLTASPFYGGPERQMLGLAKELAGRVRTVLLSFSEGGNCRPFVDRARLEGVEAHELRYDTPRFREAIGEIVDCLHALSTDILCVHGYKAGLLGRISARRARIPVVAVSRGWTYQSPRVRFYEFLDRVNLRWMDRVVCVSEGQAAKVRNARVRVDRIVTIPNSIQPTRFSRPDSTALEELTRLFPIPVNRVVGAAGRLSPEKGFEVLVDTAALIAQRDHTVGFVLFGDGELRTVIEKRVTEHALHDRFVLAGFRSDLDRFLPHLDLLVQSSYTEGMPNVVLEALAAGVPVVATAVGGTPEILDEGLSGYLVPAGDPHIMADRILTVLSDTEHRRALGSHGKQRVQRDFSFETQAIAYARLFDELLEREDGQVRAARTISQNGNGDKVPPSSYQAE
jgi:glycosyltransferase involved in cell wall biosynthesis